MILKQASTNTAQDVADLTFELLTNCQQKEVRLSEQLGITVAEFRCLRCFRRERELQVSTLVARLHLSASRITRLLEALENRGYLVRSIDREDRRNILVRLTDKGYDFSRSLEQRYTQIHVEILSGIPEHLHESVVASLENLLSSLVKWLKRT